MISDFIINYVNGMDEISVPQLQYVLGINYRVAHDAVMTLKKIGAITPVEGGNKYALRQGVLIGRSLGEEDCTALGKKLSTDAMKFLGSLYDEARELPESIEAKDVDTMLEYGVIKKFDGLCVIALSTESFKRMADVHVEACCSAEILGGLRKRVIMKRILLASSAFTAEDRIYHMPNKPKKPSYKPRFTFPDYDDDGEEETASSGEEETIISDEEETDDCTEFDFGDFEIFGSSDDESEDCEDSDADPSSDDTDDADGE